MHVIGDLIRDFSAELLLEFLAALVFLRLGGDELLSYARQLASDHPSLRGGLWVFGGGGLIGLSFASASPARAILPDQFLGLIIALVVLGIGLTVHGVVDLADPTRAWTVVARVATACFGLGVLVGRWFILSVLVMTVAA